MIGKSQISNNLLPANKPLQYAFQSGMDVAAVFLFMVQMPPLFPLAVSRFHSSEVSVKPPYILPTIWIVTVLLVLGFLFVHGELFFHSMLLAVQIIIQIAIAQS